MFNIRKILDTHALMADGPLESKFARSLLTIAKHESLEDWLASIPKRARKPELGQQLVSHLQSAIALNGRSAGGRKAKPPRSLSFARTAKRAFEKAYWNLISQLATGQYVNKDNADCVARSGHAGARPASAARPGSARRLPAQLLHAARGRQENAAKCWSAICRSAGRPISVSLDGRLGAEPGPRNVRTRSAGGHSRPRSQPGRHHGRPLRHGLHGRHVRLRARRARARGFRPPGPTTTTRPPPR